MLPDTVSRQVHCDFPMLTCCSPCPAHATSWITPTSSIACSLTRLLTHSLTPSRTHVSFARVRYTQFCISLRLPCLAAVHAACTGMPAHVDKFPWLGQVSLAVGLTSYWLLVTVSVPHCLVYTLDTMKWLQWMSQCGKLVNRCLVYSL